MRGGGTQQVWEPLWGWRTLQGRGFPWRITGSGGNKGDPAVGTLCKQWPQWGCAPSPPEPHIGTRVPTFSLSAAPHKPGGAEGHPIPTAPGWAPGCASWEGREQREPLLTATLTLRGSWGAQQDGRDCSGRHRADDAQNWKRGDALSKLSFRHPNVTLQRGASSRAPRRLGMELRTEQKASTGPQCRPPPPRALPARSRLWDAGLGHSSAVPIPLGWLPAAARASASCTALPSAAASLRGCANPAGRSQLCFSFLMIFFNLKNKTPCFGGPGGGVGVGGRGGGDPTDS